MSEETTTANTTDEELKRMNLMFRAFMLIVFTFYRRSMVVGMGALQTKSDVLVKAHLLSTILIAHLSNDEFKYDTDYLFGRMMKTTFYMNIKTGKVWAKYSTNPEYTSWIGLKESPSDQEKTLICTGIEACMEDEFFKSGVGLEVVTRLADANA